MRVLIAEDEPLARSLLRTLLAEAGGVEVVGEARNAPEALDLAARLQPDAVFLDIDMPGGDGIGAAHQLQRRSASEIVFVTAHEPHAVDAFELGAADYVLKPVRRPRLAKTLERVRDRMRAKSLAEADVDGPADDAVWVRTRHGKVRLAIRDILWIEAARDHVYLHTSAGSYLHRTTMAELEVKLQGTGLARVQRSAFVRLASVAALGRRGKATVLELESGAFVSVGLAYKRQVLGALAAQEESVRDSRRRHRRHDPGARQITD